MDYISIGGARIIGGPSTINRLDELVSAKQVPSHLGFARRLLHEDTPVKRPIYTEPDPGGPRESPSDPISVEVLVAVTQCASNTRNYEKLVSEMS